MRASVSALFLVLCVQGLQAQDIPFLSKDEYNWMVNEISGDSAYEHIRYFTQFHRPRAGSPGLMAVAEYVEKKAREYGLDDVRLIRQPSQTTPWHGISGEIWLRTPHVRRLASTVQHPLHLADYSRTTHLPEVEIVFVGNGSSQADYEGKDVMGKLVLSYGSPYVVMREAVWTRGAVGIITYPNPDDFDYPSHSLSRPDAIHWSTIPAVGPNGELGTFGFVLTERQGRELELSLRGQEKVTAQVDIEAEFGEEKWQVMVEGFIRGTEISDQDIVLTGHLQEEKFSANDDASGSASVLEIARSLQKLISTGKLAQPRRNLRFWWVTEISSQRQLFADDPEVPKTIMANINQDMVGANQGQDILRVQNMTRLPFSRFHFLNDVAERILEFAVQGNTSNLAVLQAGSPAPYPMPILSRLGTRHRYNAAAIPFHNNTDHMPFNEAPIGIPAITFTNWPDNYIHTTDDDLWNIDPTQLQRNAFMVAAIGYVMAQAGEKNFDAIASEVSGRALTRIGEDLRLALGWVAQGAGFYFPALHQLDAAAERELQAARSLQAIASTDSHRKRVDLLTAQIRETTAQYKNLVKENARSLYGSIPLVEQLSQDEQTLQGWLPKLIAGPKEFLDNRGKVNPAPGLDSLMAFEVMNFVDGKRSGLDIFRLAAAEARRAGAYYYGKVEAAGVRQYLENLKEAGLVSF